MQNDLSKNRSQSSPNCLIDYQPKSELNDQLKNDVNSVDNLTTESGLVNTLESAGQRFHQYDLRNFSKNRTSAKDDSDSAELRSTNSSPNLNQTQRKKQRKFEINTSFSINTNSFKFENSNHLFVKHQIGEQDWITALPDEILFKILTHLQVEDLCNVSSVSKKFYKISNDTELWKQLYQETFEYDMPIMKDECNKFAFINPSDNDLDEPNVWKASVKQFYKSIHIRPADSERNSIAKEIAQIGVSKLFATTKPHETSTKTIFIHRGTYRQETLRIQVDVNLIGAAPGPVDSIAKQVIIENTEKPTIHFTEGVKHSYLGYVTLLSKPPEQDESNALGRHPPYALLIDKKAKPKIFNCIIKSMWEGGASVYVVGDSTEPIMKNCVISDCKNVGIYVDSFARGFFESNLIARNVLAGVWVRNSADPVFRKNTIKEGFDVGVFCFDNSLGWFEQNDIHSNRIAGFEGKQKLVLSKQDDSSKLSLFPCYSQRRLESNCNQMQDSSRQNRWCVLS